MLWRHIYRSDCAAARTRQSEARSGQGPSWQSFSAGGRWYRWMQVARSPLPHRACPPQNHTWPFPSSGTPHDLTTECRAQVLSTAMRARDKTKDRRPRFTKAPPISISTLPRSGTTAGLAVWGRVVINIDCLPSHVLDSSQAVGNLNSIDRNISRSASCPSSLWRIAHQEEVARKSCRANRSF